MWYGYGLRGRMYAGRRIGRGTGWIAEDSLHGFGNTLRRGLQRRQLRHAGETSLRVRAVRSAFKLRQRMTANVLVEGLVVDGGEGEPVSGGRFPALWELPT